MIWNNRLRKLREQSGYTLKEISVKLGVSEAMVSRHESSTKNIPYDIIEEYANIYGCTPSYIMGWDSTETSTDNGYYANLKELHNGIVPISTVKVPLVGEIACGEPIEADEEIEYYVEPDTPINCDFALKAKGDSMEGVNLKIHDGDIVFVRKQSTVENGEVAVVIIDNDATLKRVYYYPDDKKLVLQAENSKYAPFVYVGPELETVHILGKAVAFQSYIK